MQGRHRSSGIWMLRWLPLFLHSCSVKSASGPSNPIIKVSLIVTQTTTSTSSLSVGYGNSLYSLVSKSGVFILFFYKYFQCLYTTAGTTHYPSHLWKIRKQLGFCNEILRAASAVEHCRDPLGSHQAHL